MVPQTEATRFGNVFWRNLPKPQRTHAEIRAEYGPLLLAAHDSLCSTAVRLSHWQAGPCLPGRYQRYVQRLADRYQREKAELEALIAEARAALEGD